MIKSLSMLENHRIITLSLITTFILLGFLPIKSSVTLVGTLRPASLLQITSREPSMVENILVPSGARVLKGQELAKIVPIEGEREEQKVIAELTSLETLKIRGTDQLNGFDSRLNFDIERRLLELRTRLVQLQENRKMHAQVNGYVFFSQELAPGYLLLPDKPAFFVAQDLKNWEASAEIESAIVKKPQEAEMIVISASIGRPVRIKKLRFDYVTHSGKVIVSGTMPAFDASEVPINAQVTVKIRFGGYSNIFEYLSDFYL